MSRADRRKAGMRGPMTGLTWEARNHCGCRWVMQKREDRHGPFVSAVTDLDWTPCETHDHLRELAKDLPPEVVRRVVSTWPPPDGTAERIARECLP